MVKQRKGVKEELIAPIKNIEPKSTKPTPEQMRIAQILEKKVVDSTIKLKLKQIMDATQRSADDVYVALHDSDFDVNRAVNLLIEGADHLAEWCTNEKRKKKLVEIKEKKEEAAEEEVPKPEKRSSTRGRGDERRRPGRRQDGGRRPQKTQEESRRQQPPKAKRPGFGSMVFERSNPPLPDKGCLPPVKNQWEKPLLRNNEDDWDCEEFQGSLSQTQIFTSSKRPDNKDVPVEQKATTESSPPLQAQPLSSVTFTNKAHDTHDVGLANPAIPQKRDATLDIRPNPMPTQDRPLIIPPPPDSCPDFLYRLNFPKSDHREEKRAPSKIPTSAVEMPPEMKPSLSFLDIQFGAMDLGPCHSETSIESHSSAGNSQNTSSTMLIASPGISSSSTMTQLMANQSSGISSASTSIVTSSISTSNGKDSAVSCISAPGMSSAAITTVNSCTNSVLNSIPNTGMNITTSGMNSSNSSSVNLVPPSTMSGSISHLVAQNSISSGSNLVSANNMPNISHMVPNTMNHNLIGPSGSAQNRFMQSGQSFNGSHMQYGIINPPTSSHGFESRENLPAAHLPQPHSHLPPFKSPPGVPKGTVVPNLQPGSLMGNQYIVGQGNVPYFPHPPIYYYEEVPPPVMNSQQRLATMTSHTHHYDVGYQTAPSSRDSVHYNV